MKPKLAIYGDSWTQPRPPASAWGVTDTSTDKYNITDCWAWNPILTDNYAITNFGNTGTDVASYHKMFMETHHKFDAIVFIAANPNIVGYKFKQYNFYYTPEKGEKDSPVNFLRSANLLTDEDKQQVLKIYEHLRGYCKHIINLDLQHAGVAGLVDEVMSTRPDAVVLPSFKNKYYFNKFNNFCLSNIMEMEIECFGIQEEASEFFKTHMELRHSHMTNENNILFANYIYKRLQGEKIDLTLDYFYKPTPEDLHRYFKPI
jgi:hypothetical protein